MTEAEHLPIWALHEVPWPTMSALANAGHRWLGSLGGISRSEMLALSTNQRKVTLYAVDLVEAGLKPHGIKLKDSKEPP